ncbi:MAG: uracil-DNA glycosylase family protein [Hyphomicrobiales bacterium]|nr:uracil-DNA glycosylase family protein [Hyphomicrobiales bacterium]OQW84353.1 MAG: uracil-DNA glycosylase [Proteobacteria bacterium ST_bin15]
MSESFARLASEIRACRVCVSNPRGSPLPHEPRPVFRGKPGARIVLAGQAPGTKVHLSGKPYTDASGERLRSWLGVDDATFYDETNLAIIPMGFCFPGQDAKGGDLPPRPECAATWHDRLMQQFRNIELLVLIGQYAQRYHFRRLGLDAHLGSSLQATVENWQIAYGANASLRVIPVPHPSWRNTGWLKKNPWYERDLLPVLQADVRRILGK